MKFQIIADKIIKKRHIFTYNDYAFFTQIGYFVSFYLLSVDLVANSGIAEEDKNH